MSLNYTVSRTTPIALEIVLLDGDRFCDAADEAAAQRIIACVNACKDIETKYLLEFPNWKLAVATMARPGDVCNLILKLGTYREALEKIAKVSTEDFAYVGDLKVIAEEALK